MAGQSKLIEDCIRDISVSIIMPIYNPGMYLEATLDSLVKQTHHHFEVICVDDASTDEKTLKILEKYQKVDNRIRVITLTQNVGAGEARNIGLCNATEEFLMFLDADDLFEPDLIESMLKKMLDENAELCVCRIDAFELNNGKKQLIIDQIPSKETFERKEEGWLNSFSTVPWNKMCRKSFLIENDIRFQTIRACNDVFFSQMVLLSCRKLAVVADKTLVHYRLRTEKEHLSGNRSPYYICEAEKFTLAHNRETENVKEIMIALMFIGCVEIENYDNDDIKKKAYQEIQSILSVYQNRIVFSSNRFQCLVDAFLSHFYSEKWVKILVFYSQMKSEVKEIRKQLCKKEKLGLWGVGRRGRAFLELCKEEKISIDAITDQRQYNSEELEDIQPSFLKQEFFLESVDYVIACNHVVFNMLKNKNVRVILDLEDFSQ